MPAPVGGYGLGDGGELLNNSVESIREETPADHAAIEAVTVAAFLNAPHSDPTEHCVVRALRSAGQLTVSLVAEEHGAIVGHVAVSPVSISSGADRWYGLGPISVVPERQGQGVGSRLMHRALAALRERGAAGCVVLGEPGYYARFGFRVEPALRLPGAPDMYFQAISFAGPVPVGTVAYHAAFEVRAS